MADPQSHDSLAGRIRALEEENLRLKKANAALAQGEAWLRPVFECSKDAIFITDADGRFLMTNEAAASLTGYSLPELLTMRIPDLHDAEDLSAYHRFFERIMAGEAIDSIARIRRRDGSKVDTEFSNRRILVDGMPVMHTIARDISERKQAEKKLRESEAKFRTLVMNSPVGIFLTHSNGEALHVNPAMARILGVSTPGEVVAYYRDLGRQFYVDPGERRNFLNLLRENGWVENFECEAMQMNGNRIWVSMNARIREKMADGSFLIDGFAMDITARKLSEQKLRESEEKYRLLVENANEVIFIAQDGVIKFPNPKALELAGYTAEEFARIPFAELIHPDDREMVVERHLKRLAGETVPSEYAFRIVMRSGGERIVRINTVQIEWEGRPAVLIFARDITRQQKLERQIQQAQRLEAIGTLAGGIAHDFNNILAPIIGYAELIEIALDTGSPLVRYTDGILQAAFRARSLVSQILAFSRQTELEKRPIMLQHILKEALKLIRATFPATIEIQADIRDECGRVMADPTQIHQIIMNLATNSYHAMENTGGTLQVTLQEAHIQPEDIHEAGLIPGAYACLTVADTGCGLEKELVQKVFDPYFTTREIGKGTGLGLSVVHGIVKSCGGSIGVRSQPGEGAEFSVFLPLVEEKTDTEFPRVPEPVSGGTERILLVDDEETIVHMGSQTLERLGYRVTAFANSGDALAKFRRNPRAFDLVITDMTMPGMTGIELSRAIKTLRPEIPVLITTGFSNHIDAEKAAELGFEGFIMKPVVRGEMAAAVRKALSSHRDSGEVPPPHLGEAEQR